MDLTYIILTVAIMLVSRFVSGMLQKRFAQYSQVPLPYTGSEVAQMMLRDHEIDDVEVLSVHGQLTDHYHPVKKTVNLSEVVCHQSTVAAAAVAAHECGHAVQHARSYAWLKMRSKLVPVVNISSKFLSYVLLAGLALAAAGNPILLLIGVIMFAATTLFSVVTLPVEFDASRRALAWIDERELMGRENHEMAKKALFWAAMTYTVAALGSVGQLLYFIQMFLRARDR